MNPLPEFSDISIPVVEEFREFPKIARLNRDIVITEKIDGTNAQIFIGDCGEIIAGSRSRYLTPQNDNFGFARWVEGNKTELLKLGPGRHFGEWWGQGIQRGYGQRERRFSLFNTHRWSTLEVPSACCSVVPVLYAGAFLAYEISRALFELGKFGSKAAPGFMQPEGVVIYHTAAKTLFKMTLENDGQPKMATAIKEQIACVIKEFACSNGARNFENIT